MSRQVSIAIAAALLTGCGFVTTVEKRDGSSLRGKIVDDSIDKVTLANVTLNRLSNPKTWIDDGGRRWEVEVLKAGDAIQQRAQQSEQEKAAERDRRWQAAVGIAREAILTALTTADDHQDVASGLQARSGHKGKSFDAALGELLREGELIEVETIEPRRRVVARVTGVGTAQITTRAPVVRNR